MTDWMYVYNSGNLQQMSEMSDICGKFIFK